MTQWYVKELSKLTQVSVQTLHHYDRINLLTPSVRLTNGYRSYSEEDLLRLQQIIALKFFGFGLSQIKILLNTDANMIEHFTVQSQFLEEKAKKLLEASQALKEVTLANQSHKSIHWETIIKLIEVYRMTQQLEKTWIGKALDQDELKQYANFERDLMTKLTPEEQKNIEESWDNLIAQVNANLNTDPAGEIGLMLGKRFMDWVNYLYGNEYSTLRTAIWEKGFKEGHAGDEHNLSPKAIAWIDKAIDAYYEKRIHEVLNQVEIEPNEIVAKQWNDLLNDMYGNGKADMNELLCEVMKSNEVSQAAKKWLKQYMLNNEPK